MFKQRLYLITVAKHSMDETNTPPTIIVKSLVPFSNKKSIIFWICKGATYHWTLYLRNYRDRITDLRERWKDLYDSYNGTKYCFIFTIHKVNYRYFAKSLLRSNEYVIIMIYDTLSIKVAYKQISYINNYKCKREESFLNIFSGGYNLKDLQNTRLHNQFSNNRHFTIWSYGFFSFWFLHSFFNKS